MQGEVDVEALPIESIKRIREAYKALRYAAQAATAELAAQLKTAQSALPEGSVAAGNTVSE
jgi:kinesin family protein 6/9